MKNMKIERILVPVDYSDESRRAAEYAISFAGLVSARVELLHVASPPAEYLPLDKWIFGDKRNEKTVEQVQQKVRDAAQQALDAFVEELTPPTPGGPGTRVEMGVPSRIIGEILRAESFDLVVMGAHGQTGSRYALLGSTTSRVIRRARCPVLTVP